MDPDLGFRYDPTALGPLNDSPTAVAGAGRLFAGDGEYFSLRKLNARVKLCERVAPLLQKVLHSEETVLHILPAFHHPRFLESSCFGLWWTRFFRVALVFTDRRIIEILMNEGIDEGTRIWSYSWGQLRMLKLGMSTLKLKAPKARTQRWRILQRGDRRLLKHLVPKIRRLFPEQIQNPLPVPLWHCPECGVVSSEHPKQCKQCQTLFKSRGLASALSLAFPGAGLLYAGHPFLAVMDLLGEVASYVIVASLFLTATDSAEVAGAATAGLILLFLTKVESAHVASVLAHRTKVDRERPQWCRVAKVGAIASCALLALPPLLSSLLVNKLDRDLDLSSNTLGWSGGYDPQQWEYGIDSDQRSEWICEDGQAVFVWSWAMDVGETYEDLIAGVKAASEGVSIKPTSVAGLDGFQAAERYVDDEGDAYVRLRWILFDRPFNDVHLVAVDVGADELESAESDIRDLLDTAVWIPAR